ncbi:transcriptional antitermination N peptide [Pantoea septica]|uniref:transcriptional antitermination N peptide n=1 Tax=Pantoea septica TaxID=472695 RepID=UPI002897595F|nr:hypothetical protein [Pantoea septica]
MFAATNSVSRRYLKRGELIAKRRAEATAGKTRVDVSAERVSRAVSAPSLREKHEDGAMCLPAVAIYSAGHRKVRKDATHIIK